MRLDKFLKVSRIIKRRTIASEACSLDRVLINGKESKPSKTVSIGDTIGVKFGDKLVNFRVISVPEGNVNKNSASEIVEVIDG